jgi:hypothetical protein
MQPGWYGHLDRSPVPAESPAVMLTAAITPSNENEHRIRQILLGCTSDKRDCSKCAA